MLFIIIFQKINKIRQIYKMYKNYMDYVENSEGLKPVYFLNCWLK